MAQVAGRGQERGLAVLVSAVTGNRLQRGERRADLGSVFIGEGQRKEPERVVDVFAFAEPGADDDARDARLIEDEAARDVGHRDPMTRGHRCGRRQHALQRTPPAGNPQEAAVLHQRPRGEALPVGLRRSEPAFGEPATRQRAVRQQVHAGARRRTAPARRPHADRAARTTPGSTRPRCRSRHHAQVGRIDVGQAEVTDEALGSSDPEGRTAFRASSHRRSSRRGTAGGRSSPRRGA